MNNKRRTITSFISSKYRGSSDKTYDCSKYRGASDKTYD